MMFMPLQPLKIDDCPQFYTATIKDWKKLLKPEKYKMVVIESLHYLFKEERVIARESPTSISFFIKKKRFLKTQTTALNYTSALPR